MEQNGTRRYTYTVACVYILYPVHEKCRQGADSRQSGSAGSPVTFRDPPWPLCRGAGTHRSGGQSHSRSSSVRPRIGKGGERSVRAISRIRSSLSLFFSLNSLPRICPAYHLILGSTTRRERRKIERCLSLMRLVNWFDTGAKISWSEEERREKRGWLQPGRKGESNCQLTDCTGGLLHLAHKSTACALLRRVTELLARTTELCRSVIPASRELSCEVFTSSRGQTHCSRCARCPRFRVLLTSCASLVSISYSFILDYYCIYVYSLRLVRSLSLSRVSFSIRCRSIGNRLSVKRDQLVIFVCAGFFERASVVSNLVSSNARYVTVECCCLVISESIPIFFLSPRFNRVLKKARLAPRVCINRKVFGDE